MGQLLFVVVGVRSQEVEEPVRSDILGFMGSHAKDVNDSQVDEVPVDEDPAHWDQGLLLVDSQQLHPVGGFEAVSERPQYVGAQQDLSDGTSAVEDEAGCGDSRIRAGMAEVQDDPVGDVSRPDLTTHSHYPGVRLEAATLQLGRGEVCGDCVHDCAGYDGDP